MLSIGVVKNWNFPDIIGTLVGLGALFIVFLAIEWWQGERAILVPGILKNRTIGHNSAFSFLYLILTPFYLVHNSRRMLRLLQNCRESLHLIIVYTYLLPGDQRN